MERLTLKATVRDTKTDVDQVRAEARIPAVIYGGERKEALSLSVDRSELLQLLKQVTESTIIDVDIDGTASPALVGEIQYHPISEEILHIDLRQVDMNKPVRTAIDLNFVGEAPALKLGGILVTGRESILVEALPSALISEIDVDLSRIADFDTVIHVSDITLPEGVTLLDDAHAAVALVNRPKAVKETEEKPEGEEAEAEGEEAKDGEAEASEDGEKSEDAEKSE